MKKIHLLKHLILISVILFYSILSWAGNFAKITKAHFFNTPTEARFELNIKEAPFRYNWKLSAQKTQLTLTLYPVTLLTSLPQVTSASGLVRDYHAHMDTDQTTLTLVFSIHPETIPHIYTQSGSLLHPASRLIVDLGTNNTSALSTTQVFTQKTNPYLHMMQANTSDAQNHPATEKNAFFHHNQGTETAIHTNLQNKKHVLTVMIDPGHGGKDSGAIGPDGTLEKNVVLAISKLLQKNLNQRPGFRAQLTRNSDIFIPLRQRLYIARRAKADIFIAVHADSAYKNQSAVGASVFALSEHGATSEMARWLAQKENSSELIYGINVRDDQILRSVLLDLSQTHTISVSLKIGQQILDQLSDVTKLHYKQVEQAAFVVLKSPDIPSLLVETGYISNPAQAQKLRDPIYQAQLADAIANGISAFQG